VTLDEELLELEPGSSCPVCAVGSLRVKRAQLVCASCGSSLERPKANRRGRTPRRSARNAPSREQLSLIG
jgi:hypothetical protein